MWRSGLAWQITLFMGLQSLVFYSTIAWLAEILRDRGLSAFAAGWLVSVAQLAGLVTSLAVPPIATRRPRQRVHASASALVSLAGYSGLLLSGRGLLPLWCGLIGLGLIHDLTGAWTVPLAGLAATTVAILLAGLAAGRDALVAAPRPLAQTAPATPAARAGPEHRGG